MSRLTIVQTELIKDSDMLALEAVLYQELKFVLHEAFYFRNRDKGSIYMDFIDHGKYKGSGYTVKD